jgi:hypothetical protein
MATYRIGSQPKGPVSLADRLRGQVIITNETNAEIDVSASKGVFFLENIKASAGTLSLVDGAGTTIATGIDSLDFQIDPLMCKHGITVTGDILYMKGFILNGVLS